MPPETCRWGAAHRPCLTCHGTRPSPTRCPCGLHLTAGEDVVRTRMLSKDLAGRRHCCRGSASSGLLLLGFAQEIGPDQGLGGLSVGHGDDPAPPAVPRLPPPGQQARNLACPVPDPYMDTPRLRPVNDRATGRVAGWPCRPVSQRAELRTLDGHPRIVSAGPDTPGCGQQASPPTAWVDLQHRCNGGSPLFRCSERPDVGDQGPSCRRLSRR